MFPYFNILGKTVGSYAFCCFIGIVVSTAFATSLAKKIKICFEDIILMVLVIMGGVVLGGHWLYAVTNIDKIFNFVINIDIKNISFAQIKTFFNECFGGMVYYGGFIGAVIALPVYIDCAKIGHRHDIMDIFTVCVPLFHLFGRIGCFLGGCCYGIESKFGFIVTDNNLIPEINGVRRLPIALIEAGCNLLIFLFLFYLLKKENKKGKLIFVYSIIYPTVRFVLEFFRADEIRGIFFSLSTSQWISIILFIIGIIGYKRFKESYLI